MTATTWIIIAVAAASALVVVLWVTFGAREVREHGDRVQWEVDPKGREDAPPDRQPESVPTNLTTPPQGPPPSLGP